MEERVNQLVDKAWSAFLGTPPDKRLMIGIGGAPGSGKTTLSRVVTNALNARFASQHPSAPPIAAFVPMDGYHFTRAQLDQFPDPVVAHARRGAEFTFDGERFLQLVLALSVPLTETSTTIWAPSFDHAVKDPKENDIAVEPTHRIVVFEGNYVLLNKAPWATAASMMNLRWFVSVDPTVARERLATRHVAAGIVSTLEEGERRAVENDIPNGEEVIRNKVDVDEVITSHEDERWVDTHLPLPGAETKP